MKKEIWKDIEGYPTYQVSNTAKVRRLTRPTCPGSQLRKERKKFIPGFILSPRLNIRAGYPSVALCTDVRQKQKHFTIHRLMAIAFIPNPLNLPQINHKNGIKTDNRLENFEWCDASHNTNHAYANGLIKIRSKVPAKDIPSIRKEYAEGGSPTVIAKRYGVWDTCIGNIVARRTWKRIP